MKKRKAVHKPVPALEKNPEDHGLFLWVFFAFCIISVISVSCADRARYPRDLGPPPGSTSPASVAVPAAAQYVLKESYDACRDKQWQLCLEKANAAIVLLPNYSEAFINRGVAEIELGRYDAAISDEETALSLKPSPLARGNLGWARAEKAKHR